MKTAILLSFLALCAPAYAQEHGTTHARNHTWYYGLKDKNGRSCCSNQDCDKAVDWQIAGGHYQVRLAGRDKTPQWCKVPEEKVLPIRAPDGDAHVCASLRSYEANGCPQIYCFVPGDFY